MTRASGTICSSRKRMPCRETDGRRGEIFLVIEMNASPSVDLGEKPFAFLPLPAGRSTAKPRRVGLTMMIDQGLPAHYAEDLIACAGEYIDLAKIKTGTARLYPERVLRAKLE